MSEQQEYPSSNNFVTARELNFAVLFLSSKLDDGFKVTHEKQDATNGRLLRAEGEIQKLQQGGAVDRAVEDLAERARNRMDTWKVAALSTVGTSALGGVSWLLAKVFG